MAQKNSPEHTEEQKTLSTVPNPSESKPQVYSTFGLHTDKEGNPCSKGSPDCEQADNGVTTHITKDSSSNMVPNHRKLYFFLILFALIIIGLLFFIFFYQGNAFNNPKDYQSRQLAQNNTYPTTLSDKDLIKAAHLGDTATTFKGKFDISKGFHSIVDYALPAVVNISAVKTIDMPTSSIPNKDLTPFLKEFFKQFSMPSKKEKGVSLGSGFIVRSDGFVVTNYHVVQGAKNIKITLHNGNTLPAKMYAVDPLTDLAVLKVEATNLPSIQFNDSSKVHVGDWVIAIGNPFGLGGTVSAGIVSARGRDINIGLYDEFIQTDAAINRGNSGGPMIDTYGKVIGINTAIFSTSNGGSIGIGFSVPSNLVQNVVAQLIINKQVTRGWIGVQIQDVDEGMKQVLKLPQAKGTIVANVTNNSPASKAGLQVGDVIIAINGSKIIDKKTVVRLISMMPPGTVAELSVISQGVNKSIPVTVEKLPESLGATKDLTSDNVSQLDSYAMQEVEFDELGIKAVEITDDVRKIFNLPKDVSGVLISAISEDSVAEAKGLRGGLLIVSVNGKPINKIADLKAILNDNTAETFLFLLQEPLRKDNFFFSLQPTKYIDRNDGDED